ncbi:MAG: hypothetical protein ACTJGH_02055 [Peptoniphilaceae bacterium]
MKDFLKFLNLNMQSIKNYIKISFSLYIFLFIVIALQKYVNPTYEYNLFKYFIFLIYPILIFLPLVALDEKILVVMPINKFKSYPFVHLLTYIFTTFIYFIPILLSNLFFEDVFKDENLSESFINLMHYILILSLWKNLNKDFKRPIDFFKNNFYLFVPIIITMFLNYSIYKYFPTLNIIIKENKFYYLIFYLDLIIALFITLILRSLTIDKSNYEKVKCIQREEKSIKNNKFKKSNKFKYLKLWLWTKFLNIKYKNFSYLVLVGSIFLYRMVFNISKNAPIFFYIVPWILILYLLRTNKNQKFLITMPIDFYKTSNYVKSIKIIVLSLFLLLIFFINNKQIDILFIKNFITFTISCSTLLFIFESRESFTKINFFNLFVDISIFPGLLSSASDFLANNLSLAPLVIVLIISSIIYISIIHLTKHKHSEFA